MICPECGERWAPFPPKDFVLHMVLGFVAKTKKAITDRAKKFESDEKGVCDECKKEEQK